ncbi:hypothetical protein HYPSUDRAFT_193237 [Hypholoma sublateritium FD-334 SS-4]|uniref:Cytochrome P450 n=1 Tax=Hypholoma sublateritium (strain FD-334 SS-4) TaxID=945553 RepID=A0A0D2NIE5_HYPSF|nr:hypothetical protein HYPSUDRAFT_193237 [Hypholoma sublateritium FD-334 SS-4]
MNSALTIAFSALASGVVVLCALWAWNKSHTIRHFPPGPKPWPIIGNLLDIPMRHAANVYLEWSVKYKSHILHASAFGSHVLILNKLEDAVELLENRSQKYSSRPEIPVLGMLGWQGNIPFMSYGHIWRVHKKVCQQSFRQEAQHLYNPVQIDKIRLFLRNLLETPDNFEQHNKLFSVGVPLATMYGYNVQAANDPCVAAADEGVHLAGPLCMPGGTLLNVFPALRHIPTWVPGTGSMRTVKRARALTEEMIRVPMDDLKKRMAEGPVPPSLVSTFLEKKNTTETSKQEEEVVANVAYTVYGAASDTTIAATSTFFYLMATHPEVQRKAQAELDRVVGPVHLPTFEDRYQLPYVEAIYRELLRWRPPLTMCVPHILTEDDYYKGYYIQKGTAVLANIWSMSHNEEVYENPFEFVPERFLDEHGDLTKNDRVLAYGFGRRICVGKHVASSSMWLIIASILATFNIGKAKDSHGNEIPINDQYMDPNGFVQHKAPFKCSITPRSDRVKDLLTE